MFQKTTATAAGRYEAAGAEREKAAAGIRQRGIRRRESGRFITKPEKLPGTVPEFDDALRGSPAELAAAGKDKTMAPALPGGRRQGHRNV